MPALISFKGGDIFMNFYTLVSDNLPVISIYSSSYDEISALSKEYTNIGRNCVIENLERSDIDYESHLAGVAHWELSANDPTSYLLVLDKKYRNVGIRNILVSITKDASGFSYVVSELGHFNLFITDGLDRHRTAQAGYLHTTDLAVVCKTVEDIIIHNLTQLRTQADALLLKIEDGSLV